MEFQSSMEDKVHAKPGVGERRSMKQGISPKQAGLMSEPKVEGSCEGGETRPCDMRHEEQRNHSPLKR